MTELAPLLSTTVGFALIVLIAKGFTVLWDSGYPSFSP